MSHATLFQATQDSALQERVMAAAQKEVLANPTFGDTFQGGQLKSTPGLALTWFLWPAAVDYEDEYAYAVDGGNPNPGGDPAVITDENLSSVVQAHWPADPQP